MTRMVTKRARGKCIANAMVCQLCLTFLYQIALRKRKHGGTYRPSLHPVKKVKKRIAQLLVEFHLTATGRYLPYGIWDPVDTDSATVGDTARYIKKCHRFHCSFTCHG